MADDGPKREKMCRGVAKANRDEKRGRGKESFLEKKRKGKKRTRKHGNVPLLKKGGGHPALKESVSRGQGGNLLLQKGKESEAKPEILVAGFQKEDDLSAFPGLKKEKDLPPHKKTVKREISVGGKHLKNPQEGTNPSVPKGERSPYSEGGKGARSDGGPVYQKRGVGRKKAPLRLGKREAWATSLQPRSWGRRYLLKKEHRKACKKKS